MSSMLQPRQISSRRTILVVDDAEDCVATLNVALTLLPGISVLTAKTAEEAQQLLCGGGISAVVTDLQLPAMSGLELISWIRAQPALRTIPVVVVSANPDPTAPRYAEESGANAFFSKPFSPGAVRKKLQELMHA